MKKSTTSAAQAPEAAPDSWLDTVAAVPVVGVQLVPDWGLRLPEQAEAVLAKVEPQISDTGEKVASAGSESAGATRVEGRSPLVWETCFSAPDSGTAPLSSAPPIADARVLARRLLGPMESDLREKRSALAARKVTVGLSAAEDLALEYLSWQLDRIEDAQAGERLDALERLAIENEKLGAAVGAMIAALHAPQRPPTAKRRPRRP